MKISNKVKMFGACVFAVVAMTLGISTNTFADGRYPCIKDGTTTWVSSLADCKDGDISLDSQSNSNDLMSTIQTIVNVIITIIGIVAVLIMILGGFKYMTSAGDSKKVTDGKNTILYGVIGLVIALLAYAIVNFVMSSIQ